MDTKSLIGGTTFLLIGVGTGIGSYMLGWGTLRKPGSGTVFLIASSIMVVLSLVDIIKAFAHQEREPNPLSALWKGTHWAKALFLLIVTIVFSIALDWLGYLIPTPVYIGACARLLGPHNWKMIVAISILSTVVFHLMIYSFDLPMRPFPIRN